ncbi:NAD(P)H-dependent oxidoreductase [Stappia sp. BW2]|uniref:NADPH-dependent FMN reductase n=1 Tax=Stappia sp. BW2 TaxID=2592622 RepID=UPI0011DE5C08|nr:NAD(P)H-dependent oxidoreductase [Stappia sp. BW2]TYC70910.1 NAD(P)H-dependent oxidoreductase [Stappia sp. BW2]
MTYRIATLIGSLRKESFNRTVAEALIRLAPDDFEFFEISIGNLPHYNQDDDDNQADTVRQMKAAVKGSNGVFIVTPEYNRSVPGVLKNALDLGSRPYGDNSWSGLPAGTVGVSPGSTGTAIAQSHLRTSLAFFDMPTLGQPEMYIQWQDDLVNEDGAFADDSKDFFQSWMDTFTEFVRKNAGKA